LNLARLVLSRIMYVPNVSHKFDRRVITGLTITFSPFQCDSRWHGDYPELTAANMYVISMWTSCLMENLVVLVVYSLYDLVVP
jgi:hypothetical protein